MGILRFEKFPFLFSFPLLVSEWKEKEENANLKIFNFSFPRNAFSAYCSTGAGYGSITEPIWSVYKPNRHGQYKPQRNRYRIDVVGKPTFSFTTDIQFYRNGRSIR